MNNEVNPFHPPDAPIAEIHRETTRDTLFDGRLIVRQPKQGYRFSVDSYLLIWFACGTHRDDTVADLGAGCGVVGLGLLAADQAERIIAVEVQPKLARLCSDNARVNQFDQRYRVIASDIRDLSSALEPNSCDLVVSNPPFWNPNSGLLPHDEERRVACHEILGGLDDWIANASRLIHPRGRVCLVFPVRRLDSLLIALNRRNLTCTRLCLVHPVADAAAELSLIEARTGKTGRLTVEPPLILKERAGGDTVRAQEIYSGVFSDRITALPDKRRDER